MTLRFLISSRSDVSRPYVKPMGLAEPLAPSSSERARLMPDPAP